MQEGQRRIPVQYAKRVVGRRMAGGGSTYLPLRVNMAGVIPVIFAASLMAFPPTIGELIAGELGADFSAFFSPNGAAYIIGESILIILFTYFYTAVTFNPVEQADNLKKYGGFIPGVRPGRPTAEYLDRILARLTFPGALYLAAVAALPTILINQTQRELLLRRHLDPDRRGRRARHDEAARGAADDAQLRGLPEIAAPRPGFRARITTAWPGSSQHARGRPPSRAARSRSDELRRWYVAGRVRLARVAEVVHVRVQGQGAARRRARPRDHAGRIGRVGEAVAGHHPSRLPAERDALGGHAREDGATLEERALAR